MQKKKVEFWLKLAFLVGGITDAGALIPMLSTDAAKLVWGFTGFTDLYIVAMRIAAVFMAAWTLLLFWALRKPIERKTIALFTLFVLIGFIVVEIMGINTGVLVLSKALPSIIMQALWSILYASAYLFSRRIKEI